MSEIKFFNRWTADKVTVSDLGLVNYITIAPKIFPKTGARYAGNRFHKSHTFIVERLATKLMNTGHKGKKHFKTSYHATGKAENAYKIIREVFSKIERETKKNPIYVFVKALENGAPREEIITIEYGGARYPKAVDIAPQRRVDLVLRLMVQSSYQKSFNSKKSIVDALAQEIMDAYSFKQSSAIISKKKEMERQADSAR